MKQKVIETLLKLSIAFQAGAEAKKRRIPLKQSAIKNLRPGTPQYDDFLDGYDSQK